MAFARIFYLENLTCIRSSTTLKMISHGSLMNCCPWKSYYNIQHSFFFKFCPNFLNAIPVIALAPSLSLMVTALPLLLEGDGFEPGNQGSFASLC